MYETYWTLRYKHKHTQHETIIDAPNEAAARETADWWLAKTFANPVATFIEVRPFVVARLADLPESVRNAPVHAG